MPVIAGRNVGRNDLVVMAVGVLAFIDGFLPWTGAGNFSANGWSTLFVAGFAILLSIAVALQYASRLFLGGAIAGQVVLSGASALAAAFLLLRMLSLPDGYEVKIGLVLGLVIAIVQSVFGYLGVIASGQALPWQRRRI